MPTRARGAHLVAAHPLLGSHVRLPEEPERHAWQAEVGTAALPWLADHQINNVAALPGAAYCEMALAAARTALGDASEVCDVRFERMMLLEDETPVNAVGAVQSPGVLEFVVETDQDGERERRASAVLHAAEADEPPAYDMDALIAAHPDRADGESCVSGSTVVACSSAPRSPVWSPSTPRRRNRHGACRDRLPTAIRTQQTAYGVHPALLDACFQSVAAHPGVQASGTAACCCRSASADCGCYGPTRNARYCLTRITSTDPPASRPTSICSTTTAQACSPCRACGWALACRRPTRAIAC